MEAFMMELDAEQDIRHFPFIDIVPNTAKKIEHCGPTLQANGDPPRISSN